MWDRGKEGKKEGKKEIIYQMLSCSATKNKLICFSFDGEILNLIYFVLVIKQIWFAFGAFVLVIKHNYLNQLFLFRPPA